MKLGGDKLTLKRAQRLRREMTKPERLLWAALRRKQAGLRFRSQHPAGPFVLDFYCPSAKLCVEIDGAQHDLTTASDDRRDRWLARQGIRVIRIPARDVLADPDAVARWVADQAPSGASRHLPLAGGGAS